MPAIEVYPPVAVRSGAAKPRSDNGSSNATNDETLTTGCSDQAAPLNKAATLLACNEWCAAHGGEHAIDPDAWQPPSRGASCIAYNTYGPLVRRLPDSMLSVRITPDATQMAAALLSMPVDAAAMAAAGGRRALYAAVHLRTGTTPWKGVTMHEGNGGVLSIAAGPQAGLCADAQGSAVGWYDVPCANGAHTMRVQITQLPNTATQAVPTGTLAGVGGRYVANPAAATAFPGGFGGYRFMHIKRPISTAAMRGLLGYHNGPWQVTGVAAEGLLQITKDGTRVDVESVAVVRYRGGGGAAAPACGRMFDFFDDRREFACLFDVYIDGAPVLSCVCNSRHARDADSD